MPWVVDGNNVAGGRDREPVRQASLRLAARERLRIVLFFDGAPPPGVAQEERLGAVEVRYVPHADEAILAYIRASSTGCKLVTSDRRLAERARYFGAQVVSSEAFWQKVGGAEGEPNEKGKVPAEPLEELLACTTPLPEGPQRVRRRRRHRG